MFLSEGINVRKIWIVLVALAALLPGCASQPVFEQVQDVYAPVELPAGTVTLQLPGDAAVFTAGEENGNALYFCDEYTLSIQTLEGGNLSGTLEAMTGYSLSALTVMETERSAAACYECVWASAGEGGDQVGRLLLLDDGIYHYVVTVMADADAAGALRETWDALFSSVSLNTAS